MPRALTLADIGALEHLRAARFNTDRRAPHPTLPHGALVVSVLRDFLPHAPTIDALRESINNAVRKAGGSFVVRRIDAGEEIKDRRG